MKLKLNQLIVFIFSLVSLSQFGFAAESLQFQGPFELNVSKGHAGVVSGNLKIFFESEQFTRAQALLSKPVFGKSDLVTKDAIFKFTSEKQMALATFWNGTPHKFYMIWVANLQADASFAGYWYRVQASAEEILAVLSTEVKNDPAGWQKVGQGQVMSQP